MKIPKLLLLSAAVLSLAACGKKNEEESNPSSEGTGTLQEVDFNTFKSKTLNLSTSPYDLVSTHYRAFGYQGTYQIDIDKTVTLTKKSNAWEIDVPTTHVDYACAHECKQMLDQMTLAKVISAGEPTGDVSVKYYYGSTAGFKLVTNGSFNDGGNMMTTFTTIEWNIYGDLTKDDTHTVDVDSPNAEDKSDVHVIGEFTYSKSSGGGEIHIDDEATEIDALYSSYNKTISLNAFTVKMNMTEDVEGMGSSTDILYGIYDNGEMYYKEDFGHGTNYYSVTKSNGKYLLNEHYEESKNKLSEYVDENHAYDYIYSEFFGTGLNEVMNYLYETKSLEKFGEYLVSKNLVNFGSSVGLNDFILDVDFTSTSSNAKKVTVKADMKEESCSKVLFEGMPLNKLSMATSFVYDENYLLSYETDEEIGVEMAPEMVMSMTGTSSCTFEKEVDSALKSEVIGELAKFADPEEISNSRGTLRIYLNGYDVGGGMIEDYTKSQDWASMINEEVFGYQSKAQKFINPIRGQVDISYVYNGKKVDSLTGVECRSFENELEITLTPKQSNKSVALYVYTDRVFYGTGEHDYLDLETIYMSYVVEKSASYTIQTTYNNVDYSDKILYEDRFNIEATTYDITDLDTIYLRCFKITPYSPTPFELEGNRFNGIEIPNIDELEGAMIGEVTVADYIYNIFGDSFIEFSDENEFRWVLSNGEQIFGEYDNESITLCEYTENQDYKEIDPPASYEMYVDASTESVTITYIIGDGKGNTYSVQLLFLLDK